MAEMTANSQREHVVRLLAGGTFLIFFQAYMVAPLIPRLSTVFDVSAERIGLIVPAYLIPYGLATLVYGVLSDRMGRRPIMLGSLAAFVLLTALTATVRSFPELVVVRLLTGLGASGFVPLGLALIGQLYPFAERGRPLGWLFGAMAGGMALGSTFGALLEPLVGWRWVFVLVAMFAAAMLGLLVPQRHVLGEAPPTAGSLRDVRSGYRSLLANGRARCTYGYVLLNAVFHSGVFTWLGLYFVRRHRLGEVGIGLALLGYGVPGFLFGPTVGRAADRWGRRWLIPTGLGIAGLAAGFLALNVPLVAAAILVTVLSLGYDMTQPLLAGIVTALGGSRGGQAMGLNVFTLFVGFGLGSLLFGEALARGFETALVLFGTVQLVAALAAIPLFRAEAAERTDGLGAATRRIATP